MKSAIFLALLAVLAVSGCQRPPPPSFQVEQSRTYALSKETTWANILAFLKTNDIMVVRSDPTSGVIEARRANYEDAGWAYCPAGSRDLAFRQQSPSAADPKLAGPGSVARDRRDGVRRDGAGRPACALQRAAGQSLQELAVQGALPLRGRAGEGVTRRCLKERAEIRGEGAAARHRLLISRLAAENLVLLKDRHAAGPAFPPLPLLPQGSRGDSRKGAAGRSRSGRAVALWRQSAGAEPGGRGAGPKGRRAGDRGQRRDLRVSGRGSA